MTPHTAARVKREEIIETAITFFFILLLSFLKLFTGAEGAGGTLEELETALLKCLARLGREGTTRGGSWEGNRAGRSSCFK